MEKATTMHHIWNEANDRWMYIEYNQANRVIGLNYMQGDEYQVFKTYWCEIDQGMTDFYNQMVYTFPIEKSSVDDISFINKCMWAYHSAITSYQENE
jgi:hypothetical protein